MWVTKKKLKAEITDLTNKLDIANKEKDNLEAVLSEFIEKLNMYKKKYPFELGQTVYEVQLRNSKGRFTKTKGSREYSSVIEIVVDARNYFKLAEKFNTADVFTDYTVAQNYLLNICVE